MIGGNVQIGIEYIGTMVLVTACIRGLAFFRSECPRLQRLI